ncbi:MAG: fumarylacetoacetate hydrolase family protein [Propionibacteriaceae bacterium]|nr:fumarylacetoacetate hydrolase family protein [Propionibacteriaceae bacterium]
MRIARFSLPGGAPTFGVVELEADQGQFPNTVAAITSDPLTGPVKYTGARHDLDAVRLLAPVIPRSKVVAMGRNWADHIAEMGESAPVSPTIFIKPNTSVIGPDQPIVKPVETSYLSYEGELAIVIGRICRRVPPERVAEVIFGYTCANDVTARDLQAEEDQWTRAKGFDTFCPLGPWIVTDMTLPQAGSLNIVTTVDGDVKQDGTTADMLRSVGEIVALVSGFATLLPGDVLLSGTPSGVGRLEPGQSVSVEISGLGTLTNPVVAEGDK